MDLKIGIVSKLSGFSPSGIRYFEERGIVSPSHGRDGTYRSFDLPDVARLLECRNYRECGCDTAAIAALLSHGSVLDVDGALHDCEARLRCQIEAAQRLEAFLSRRRQLVDLASHYVPGQIEILHSPATYWAFLALASGLVGMEWVAIGATRVPPPESMRAGVKPVQPASYQPMRGPGKDDIHEAISAYGETPGKVLVAVSPVSTTIAQTVVVLAWPSMPKTVEYSDMGASRPRGRRTGRRLW